LSTKPALRPLDFQPVIYEGERMWLLRDPMKLTDYQFILPPPLAQMLLFVDGTRDVHEIHHAFCRQLGEEVDLEVVQATLTQLDKACLLENDRSRAAMVHQIAEYRAQPHRAAALEGMGYPADPGELTALFDSYGGNQADSSSVAWSGRAVVSPHIDYERGGPVYARVWRQARDAVAAADLVLIFGTDHKGDMGTVTLTRQPYATPYGVLPSDGALIEELAHALGPEHAFRLELNHRDEHSVELSAVWLHYIYEQLGQEPAPMVPILCGSFQHFVGNGQRPGDDRRLRQFVSVLKQATEGRRVLAVASVDLAHVGPSFGDPFTMGAERRERLRSSDASLIESVVTGNANRFFDEVAAVGDKNRICGFSSIYLMLRYLETGTASKGVRVAYDQCPADPDNMSLVSICGLLL
jgi:AmmeMemoRadiSam system protein B